MTTTRRERSTSYALSLSLLLLLWPLLTACGSGVGSVTFTTFGESFIEEQIPAADAPDGEGFVDGYTITYHKFLLALSNVRLADAEGGQADQPTVQKIFDLSRPGPHQVVTFDEVEARRWDDVAADTLPASGAAAGNAETSDVALMNARGYVVYVEGTATKGDETYSFRWGFSQPTRYSACADANGKTGVVVPSGGSRNAQLTIHGDHLFFDDLAADDAKLRFTAFANADLDGDHEVTLDELAAVDLTTLPIDQYGTGADGTVYTLAQFVRAQTQSLVHFQGEGDCQIR